MGQQVFFSAHLSVLQLLSLFFSHTLSLLVEDLNHMKEKGSLRAWHACRYMMEEELDISSLHSFTLGLSCLIKQPLAITSYLNLISVKFKKIQFLSYTSQIQVPNVAGGFYVGEQGRYRISPSLQKVLRESAESSEGIQGWDSGGALHNFLYIPRTPLHSIS